MDTNLISNFVNNLIQKTLSGEIKWRQIPEDMTVDDTTISDYLGQDEFHIIHYYESYFCAVNLGLIFLVSERNESGRDAEYSEGYNLYLQPLPKQSLSSVMFDTTELYRLKNAIELKLDLTEDVVTFMKSIMETPEGLG